MQDPLHLSAMFRSLKFRLFNLIISRYLVMIVNLLILYLHLLVHGYSIKESKYGFQLTGIMISKLRKGSSEYRKCGSQSPDSWLKRSRNTQIGSLGIENQRTYDKYISVRVMDTIMLNIEVRWIKRKKYYFR